MGKKENKTNIQECNLSEIQRYWAAKLHARGMKQTEVVELFRISNIKISQPQISTAKKEFFGDEGEYFPLPPFRTKDLLQNAEEELGKYQLQQQRGEIEDIDRFAITQGKLVAAVKELYELDRELKPRDEIIALERIQAEEEDSERLLLVSKWLKEKRENV